MHARFLLSEECDEEDYQAELKFAEKGGGRNLHGSEAIPQPPKNSGGDQKKEFRILGVAGSADQEKPGVGFQKGVHNNLCSHEPPVNGDPGNCAQEQGILLDLLPVLKEAIQAESNGIKKENSEPGKRTPCPL